MRLLDFSEIFDADAMEEDIYQFPLWWTRELLEMLQEFFLICDEGRRCKFISDENVFPHIWQKISLLGENSPHI